MLLPGTGHLGASGKSNCDGCTEGVGIVVLCGTLKEGALGNFERWDSERNVTWVKCYVGNLGSQRAHQSWVGNRCISRTKHWAKETRHIKYIYTKFKNGPDPFWGLKGRICCPCGGVQVIIRKRAKRGLLGCWWFCLLIGVLGTLVWYVCELSLSCVLMTCVVFWTHVMHTLI